MKKETNVKRVECPACGSRLFDKEIDALGHTREKCKKCKRIWRIDLQTDEFNLIGGKAI